MSKWGYRIRHRDREGLMAGGYSFWPGDAYSVRQVADIARGMVDDGLTTCADVLLVTADRVIDRVFLHRSDSALTRSSVDGWSRPGG